MMQLPESIELKPKLFGDGENGRALQHYRNDKFGVDLVSIRPDGNLGFVQHWFSEAIPEKFFKTYADLREAVSALPPCEHAWRWHQIAGEGRYCTKCGLHDTDCDD